MAGDRENPLAQLQRGQSIDRCRMDIKNRRNLSNFRGTTPAGRPNVVSRSQPPFGAPPAACPTPISPIRSVRSLRLIRPRRPPSMRLELLNGFTATFPCSSRHPLGRLLASLRRLWRSRKPPSSNSRICPFAECSASQPRFQRSRKLL